MTTWALLGDSHTFGQSGFAICDALASVRPDVRVLNAGVNGDLAWNLAERLESALRDEPDVVQVLIGTNDVNAGLHPDHAEGYMRDKGLPQSPTPEFYRTNLRRIFDRLMSSDSYIIASQIPPIGDDPDSLWNHTVNRYNAILTEEAGRCGVELLPLYERLIVAVDPRRIRSIDRTDWAMWIPDSQRSHDEDGLSWDAIADRRGLQLTHDGLHLNERSGRLWLTLLLQHLEAHR
jgi:lysophospholipase L1-like esterase